MDAETYARCGRKSRSEDPLRREWIAVIRDGLEALFADDPNVFVASNLLSYPAKPDDEDADGSEGDDEDADGSEGDDEDAVTLDVAVVFGRPKGTREDYRPWEEDNVTPQVVFAIHSASAPGLEVLTEFSFCRKYGVEEYYSWDPAYGRLVIWRRAGDFFEEVSGAPVFVSPRLGVRFELGEGPNNLRLFAPDGKPFLTYAEAVQQRNAERRRAEIAEWRAERLAAKLRALGIEPD